VNADPKRESSTFWTAFEDERSVPAALGDFEALRFRCLLGLVALDAELATRFQGYFGLDWAETTTLLKAHLDDPSTLEPLIAETKGTFSRAQWFGTLRFLAGTNEGRNFSPTFADMGCLFAVLSGADEAKGSCALLFRLQKIRNAVFHMGRPLSEIELRDGIRMLKEAKKKWGSPKEAPLVDPIGIADREAA